MSEKQAAYVTATQPIVFESTATLIVTPEWARLLTRLQQARNAGYSGAWIDLDAMTVCVAPKTELLTKRG
jgi:hypothetical protein